jgi:octaprenyl-diphosphate synthase
LMTIIKRHNTDAVKVKFLVNRVIELGGIDYARAKMEALRDEALGMLSHFPSSDSRDSLENLVHFTINRKK